MLKGIKKIYKKEGRRRAQRIGGSCQCGGGAKRMDSTCQRVGGAQRIGGACQRTAAGVQRITDNCQLINLLGRI